MEKLKAKITLIDQVNIQVQNITPGTRQDLIKKFSILHPNRFVVPSYRMGHWDGTLLYFQNNGTCYSYFLPQIYEYLINSGYEIELEDLRLDDPHTWPEFPACPEDLFDHFDMKFSNGEPIRLRHYQCTAIDIALKEKHSVLQLPTGAGKTLFTAAMCAIVEKVYDGRTLTIVPTVSLSKQTAKTLEAVGLSVGQVGGGGKKEEDPWFAQHIITTWQSLASLVKNDPNKVYHMLKNLKFVLTDEAHSAKADVLKKLLTTTLSQIPLRCSISGTIDGLDELSKWSIFCGTGAGLAYSLLSTDLQEEGFLAKVGIAQIRMRDNDVPDGATYAQENAYLVKDEDRRIWIGDAILDIVEDGQNTLVIYNNVQPAKDMSIYLKAHLGEDRVYFVAGEVDTNTRAEIFEIMNKNDGVSRVLVGSSQTVSTGIDIPHLNALVGINLSKAFTTIVQTVGRILRKPEGKTHAAMFDFFNSSKYSSRHAANRRKLYKDQKFPHTEVRFDWRNESFDYKKVKSKIDKL